MPEMNGIEAAKLIKRYRKDTQVVIMTGYDFVKKEAEHIGVPFLQKPFSVEQLGKCLSNLKGENTTNSVSMSRNPLQRF